MNGKSKNHNSIIFLTTLSVYLGLVLVGGSSPQVLAQSKKESAEPNKISILVASQGAIYTFDLNPIIELSKLSAKETLPIEISGKLILLPQEFTNWKITSAKGNQNILDFLRKEFFAPAQSSPPEATQELLGIKEIFQSVEIDKDNITITRKAAFNNVKEAVEMANVFRRMAVHAKTDVVFTAPARAPRHLLQLAGLQRSPTVVAARVGLA